MSSILTTNVEHCSTDGRTPKARGSPQMTQGGEDESRSRRKDQRPDKYQTFRLELKFKLFSRLLRKLSFLILKKTFEAFE